ncbi:tyrosine-type recombinase/integrase [Deinococcus aerolatus]|nr:tyrosine-type recombinase/integrase [Deinococcus aerolatus]
MRLEEIETGDARTTNSQRDIHPPASVVAVLRDHRTTQERDRQTADSAWEGVGAVFGTTLGGWTYPDNLVRAMRLIVEWSTQRGWNCRPTSGQSGRACHAREAGGSDGSNTGQGTAAQHLPHSLRYTVATLALRGDAPVEVVSKVLGHARVSITLDVYRHVMDNERRALVVDLFHTPPAVSGFSLPALT